MTVRVRHGKGDKERMTYATPVAMMHFKEYLLSRKDFNQAAFLNHRGNRLATSGIQKILKKIGERANVTNVHPHRFRRTLASSLAARGMDIQEISKLLGHSNLNTTMVYVHTKDSSIKMSYSKYAI